MISPAQNYIYEIKSSGTEARYLNEVETGKRTVPEWQVRCDIQ